ncbi:hypothetical protein M6B38_267190 [Iris pallida]|uniref:Uncharacterized protein n=1 Tax=Iris pallida TaxID=29817 RepID=A0AAX6I9A7_IRIPA|nr:hypothetical protein M6B38_267190 [Iris pallida]
MARECLSRCQIVSPVILRPEPPGRQAGKWTKLASATAAKPKPSASAFRIPVAPRILRSSVDINLETDGGRLEDNRRLRRSPQMDILFRWPISIHDKSILVDDTDKFLR